jgi:uncharacterized protein YjiS (DUF1127 family)
MNWFTTKRRDLLSVYRANEACRFKGTTPMATEDIAPFAPEAILGETSSPKRAAASRRIYGGNLIERARSVIRIWVERQRDRQELLNLLDQDHRIARDMGTTDQELKAWAQKPFWLS